MEIRNESGVIDIRKVVQSIWARRMLFVKVLPVVFVLSCLYIVCIPRSYTSSCRLAPEINSSGGGGMIGSLASSFGIDLSEMNTTDAITPMLYPDLMEDNKFVVELFPVKVKKADGSLETDYYDYLLHHQEYAWWSKGLFWLKSLFKSETKGGGELLESSPYVLSRGDHDLVGAIRGRIGLSLDKKTGVITVTVEDQDPYICKTMADSVSVHLQQFITQYRTNKARVDEEYYRNLVERATEEYEAACEEYAKMSDANSGLVLNRFQLKLSNLEKRMELKYAALQTLTAQLQNASAKVQERTPVFTVLKGAEMPVKPDKPKRMIFVITMVFLAGVCVCLYILRDIVKPSKTP